MKKNKYRLTTRYVVITCIILLIANLLLGIVLLLQSQSSMREVIRRHMTAVANTASSLVDGDALENFTEDDVGSDLFNDISSTLQRVKNLQENEDIKYIYLVKRSGSVYIFTIDPDPIAPAYYGKEVVYTPAQDLAWSSGKTAVDKKPFKDEWGEFYTAWAPIKNSQDVVVGMAGVDFSADMYSEQINKYAFSIILFTILSLVIGGVIMFLITSRFFKRFSGIGVELSTLSNEVDRLTQFMNSRSNMYGSSEPLIKKPETYTESDIIPALSAQIHDIRTTLNNYLQYMQKQAYTDSMTGVYNKTTYYERMKEIDNAISRGAASFALAVFDVDGLKQINDGFGHECGDMVIVDTASLVAKTFDMECLYRVGGDEFIAILDNMTEEQLEENFKKLDEDIENFNQNEKKYVMPLSISRGGAVYIPGVDYTFKEVVRRADFAMYKNKDEHYLRSVDREMN